MSSEQGIRASATEVSNYRAVFARDAIMAGIAGLLLEHPAITAGLVSTLEHLRHLQGPEGQIASNYALRSDGSASVSFGTLAPRLDAATWYLLGVSLAVRAGVIDRVRFSRSVGSVVRLLDAIEYNGRDLIYVPPGGNWADEYVTDGYILYDQVLRAWGLRLLAPLFGEPAWEAKSARIERAIDERYWGEDRSSSHPRASVSPTGGRWTFDLAGCAVLGVSGLVPSMAAAALEWIDERFLRKGSLPPAFLPVIDEAHPDWPALRRYHLHAFRNRPHEYHNGGIWPIWLGWLAVALARTGRRDALDRLAETLRTRLAAVPGYAFEEYLHGLTGVPGGVAQMAYSATGVLLVSLAASPDCLGLLTS